MVKQLTNASGDIKSQFIGAVTVVYSSLAVTFKSVLVNPIFGALSSLLVLWCALSLLIAIRDKKKPTKTNMLKAVKKFFYYGCGVFISMKLGVIPLLLVKEFAVNLIYTTLICQAGVDAMRATADFFGESSMKAMAEAVEDAAEQATDR